MDFVLFQKTLEFGVRTEQRQLNGDRGLIRSRKSSCKTKAMPRMPGYPIAQAVQCRRVTKNKASLVRRLEADQSFEQTGQGEVGADQQRPTSRKIKNQKQSTGLLVLGCKVRGKNEESDERGLKVSFHDRFTNPPPSAFDEERSVILHRAQSRHDKPGAGNQSIIPRQIDQGILPLFPQIEANPKPRKNEHKQEDLVHKSISTVSMVGHI